MRLRIAALRRPNGGERAEAHVGGRAVVAARPVADRTRRDQRADGACRPQVRAGRISRPGPTVLVRARLNSLAGGSV